MVKKRTKMMIMVLVMVLFCTQLAFAATSYLDINGHWAEDYLRWAADKSLLPVDSVNYIRPNRVVTREEFVIGLANLLYASKVYHEIDAIQYQEALTYTDISEDSELYYSLYELNLFLKHNSSTDINLTDIFPEGQFNGKSLITRYEAALLARGVTTAPTSTAAPNFRDVAATLPYYQKIVEVFNNGILKGYPDQTLKLNQTITRAEGAVLYSRINDDMAYHSSESIAYAPVKLAASGSQQAVFTPALDSTEGTRQNSHFINAVTTLEYIDFVGYIPHNEQHLYDPAPIETLWQLKNENYSNVIGNNYYLVLFDHSLGDLRKVELIKEAIQHSLNQPNAEIEGLSLFLSQAKQYLSSNELIAYSEALYQSTTNSNTKLDIGVFLAELYYENQQLNESTQIYQALLEQQPVTGQLATQLVQNYVALQYRLNGVDTAIQSLEALSTRLDERSVSIDQETKQFVTTLLKSLYAQRT